tara:strand:+ start:532 stop:960 length:429 start_codon:yes stop_codon:yes gene_type:complete
MPERKETNKIIIHCAATKPSMDIGIEEITKWHIQRGFSGCGYHYVIKRDGAIETGRAEEDIGAHAYGHNSDSIGISLVGGLSEDGKSEANYTDEQWSMLRELVEELIEKYPDVEVIGHNDVSKKDCPCFNVKEWRNNEVASR